ncbi:MAG: EAL domain-containing protein [Clostridia bacterium]|nr:EAL domain-containing protein [Clostridia bacterium]
MYQFPEATRKAYESSPLSYVYYQVLDGKAVPVLVSNGFYKNTGMGRDKVLEWIAAGMFERMHPDDVGIVSEVSARFIAHTSPYDVFFRVRVGNDYQFFHAFGHWQTMEDGTELIVIVYSNITESKEQMFSAKEQYDWLEKDRFYTDPLTGLPNINYLHEFADERVQVLRSEGRTPTVIFSDVYSMQSYNNQYGMKAGDELLCLVADALGEQFPGDLLSRGANDHFVLVTGIEDREKLTAGIEKANERIRREAQGTTSGIRSGICPMSGRTDVRDALDHARHALKLINDDMTRTWAFFSQAADDQYWKNRYIIENFDRALKNHWIKVYYQGISRIETQKISAFEALARWVDPSRGTISPGEFIPVLQRYHQLYKLDLYMLEEVCREIPIRKENNLPLVPVSINFSRQDSDHIDIAASINEMYDRYDLSRYVSRDYFIVEITEQDIAQGTERFREQLLSIRENGYRLWLDDFGSGYSSLSFLGQFKCDLIKFDMELLLHLDDYDGANRVILRGLMSIARKLGVHTLIEGLEEEEQLEFLREIGCEMAQGFYFYRPEPLDEILFRIGGGQPIRNCETKEERKAYEARWLSN